MAEWTGLEPATPGVTGRYSNQLNYHSVRSQGALRSAGSWVLRESNPRPSPCKGDALPAELSTRRRGAGYGIRAPVSIPEEPRAAIRGRRARFPRADLHPAPAVGAMARDGALREPADEAHLPPSPPAGRRTGSSAAALSRCRRARAQCVITASRSAGGTGRRSAAGSALGAAGAFTRPHPPRWPGPRPPT